MITALQENCKANWTPSQQLSIDEMMWPTRSRHFAKQFMKDKPKKFGFKFWALVDIFGPYIQNFNVYQGRREASHSHHGTEFDAVTGLLYDTMYDYRRLIVFDNYFNSVALGKMLCHDVNAKPLCDPDTH